MQKGFRTEFDQIYSVCSLVDRLGGSRVTQVFIHDLFSLKDFGKQIKRFPQFTKYDQRALLFARPHDIVCVRDMVDNEYLRFLDGFGIGPRRHHVIWASEGLALNRIQSISDSCIMSEAALSKLRELLKGKGPIFLNPYRVSDKEFRFAESLSSLLGKTIRLMGGPLEIVDYMDGKHNVRARAISLGVPIPEGEVVEFPLHRNGRIKDIHPMQVAIERFRQQTGRVIIKGSCGASGSSTFIAEDNPISVQNVIKKIEKERDNRFYIVEVMHHLLCSPNILVHIEPGNGPVSCVGITDQILDEDMAHKGNIYPSSAKTLHEMLGSAGKICKWLQAEGYSGLAGFDFVEHDDNGEGQLSYFLAEVNPRVNAAAYPRVLMEHLNRHQVERGLPRIEAFIGVNARSRAGTFEELGKLYGDLFFNPDTGRGLFPYNIGCLEKGKFSLVLFGKSRQEVLHMYEDFLKDP